LLRRYVDYISGPGSPDNTLGWHAQGERLVRMWELIYDRSPVDCGADEEAEPRRLFMFFSLLMSQVYLWKYSIFVAAAQTPIPKHIITRNVLPHPVMFWSLQTANKLVADNELLETNFLLVRDQGTGLAFVLDIGTRGVSWSPVIFDLEYGSVFPDDIPPNYRGAASLLLGCLAFLNSNYVEQVKQGLPRSMRRSKEFQDRPGGYETTVVQLRRRISEGAKGNQGGEAREWHHQWWVAGHIRAQWYPSEQAHKLIWIAPYLKGPDDKAILNKTYGVSR
jgi:hypothetical protein